MGNSEFWFERKLRVILLNIGDLYEIKDNLVLIRIDYRLFRNCIWYTIAWH